MASLKKSLLLSALLLGMVAANLPLTAQAEDENCCPPKRGDVSGRSVLAGFTSLLIWPGIGQAINDEPGKKVATHAILGLLPPVRIWSAYDGFVDREGGYWDGRI
ncbi:MAG: hypothetical protein SFZ03_08570 [Candidatus Melainabacteria bacterium]|nr:hypothetical protein [Candidatus Melainabacteria bacterium]